MNDRIGPKGLAAIESILDNPDHPRYGQTAEYAVNRWKGPPTARVEISGPAGGPMAIKTVLTSDEKRRRTAELAALAAARIAQGKKADDDGDSD